MELETFVKEALVGISNAVHEAKSQSNISIAPGTVEGETKTEPEFIEFSLVVTATTEAKGKISVFSMGEAGAGGSVEKTNRISFKVPVYFQARTIRDESQSAE
jgi:hypothetical protein